MSLNWNDRYINLVGIFVGSFDWDNISGNTHSKLKNCKKFQLHDVTIKLYRLRVEVLNVESIEEAQDILYSIIDNIDINWRIVNTHKDIQVPKELLDKIETYIKKNSRRRQVINITPPKSGTTLSEFTRDIFCFKSGKFGVIFNIYHGMGKMSCSDEYYEHKLEEFITLF